MNELLDKACEAFIAYTDWDSEKVAAREAASEIEQKMHRAMQAMGEEALDALDAEKNAASQPKTALPAGMVPVDAATLQVALAHLKGAAVEMGEAARSAMLANQPREHVRLASLSLEAQIISDRIEILLAGGGDQQ